MQAIPLAIVLVALALAAGALRKRKKFGGAKGEAERRHPEKHFEDEDDVLMRRKDDNVGGED